MRRLVRMGAAAALLLAACSREGPVVVDEPAPSPSVREAIDRICLLEGVSETNGTAKVLSVKGLTAEGFRKALEAFPGADVHLWMPGERTWLLVGRAGTNAVSLAAAMEAFAADTNCTMSVAEVFASYAGTRADILPAFASDLEGPVLPEWFVTREIPDLAWLSVSDIDADIRMAALSEIRSMQVVRRLVLEGNMLAAKATDKAGEERAIDCWARAALRNPNDPLILERVENLYRNAKGFLAVDRVLQALKCYETLVLIRPTDAVAVHNFGMCLKKIGKLDMAEKVLVRARVLSDAAADAAERTDD